MSKGSVERLRSGFRARVCAGKDPITGRQVYVRGLVRRDENAAHADCARLVEQVEAGSHPDQAATLAILLERWLEVVDHGLTTRHTTRGYVRRTVEPALGDWPLRKLQHRVDILDRLYTHLGRCSQLCDGRSFLEHGETGTHDCNEANCRPHVCRGMARDRCDGCTQSSRVRLLMRSRVDGWRRTRQSTRTRRS